MEQITVPETRRRSRSKTPFLLRSSCDGEHCADTDHVHVPVKKSPNVQPIIEEPEELSIVPPTTRNTRAAKASIAEQIIENGSSTSSSSQTKSEIITTGQNSESTTTKSTTVITTTSTQMSSTSENQSTAKVAAKGANTKKITEQMKEISQNEINKMFEDNSHIKTSTPILTTSTRRSQAQVSITNGNLSDHAAYKEYKDAGEYWNKYPKTDYTYSKLSPHRRELAPGMVAMPNMSRKSLEHHHERVNEMAASNPSQADYIRARYQSQNYEQTIKKFSYDNYYDSQDEVDLSEFDQSRYQSYEYTRRKIVHKETLIRRFFTSIITSIYTSLYRLTNVFRRSDADLYYTRIEEKAGFVSKFFSSIFSTILSVCRYIYLFISSVLYMDSWLLKSSNAENGNKKRFLLMLLILLPLLLLGGTYYYLDKPSPISLSLDRNVFDPVYLDNVKMISLDKFADLGAMSQDAWIYLRTISDNSVQEIKNIWNENFGR